MTGRWIPILLLLSVLPACSGGGGAGDGGGLDGGVPWTPDPVTRDVNVGDPDDPELTLTLREVGGENTGARTVVLIHGGPAMGSSYLRDLEVLASADLRIVTYDQRGVATSGAPTTADGYARDRLVADLEALRLDLGVETFSLVGQSWGGFIAQAYAIRHPDRLEHLVLYSSVPADDRSYAEADDRMVARLRELQAQGYIPDPLPTDPIEALAAILPLYFPDPTDVPEVDLSGQFYDPDLAWEVLAQNVQAFDFRPELGALTGPSIHLLYGGYEPFGEQTGLDLLLAMPIGVDYQTLPGCGHMSWLDCPEDALAALRADLGLD